MKTIKPGDLISVARLMIESHGYMLYPNNTLAIKVNKKDITAAGLNVPGHDFSIREEEIGKFVLNRRDSQCWYCVYLADTEDPVEMLKKAAIPALEQMVQLYEILLANAKAMVEKTKAGEVEDHDHYHCVITRERQWGSN